MGNRPEATEKHEKQFMICISYVVYVLAKLGYPRNKIVEVAEELENMFGAVTESEKWKEKKPLN